jgi:hypothetical protein
MDSPATPLTFSLHSTLDARPLVWYIIGVRKKIMQEHSLINMRPDRTPMEQNQENLEVLITMLMLVVQIREEVEPVIRETLTIVGAALTPPAEA